MTKEEAEQIEVSLRWQSGAPVAMPAQRSQRMESCNVTSAADAAPSCSVGIQDGVATGWRCVALCICVGHRRMTCPLSCIQDVEDDDDDEDDDSTDEEGEGEGGELGRALA